MDFIDQKAILFLDPVAFNGVKQKKTFFEKMGDGLPRNKQQRY
jgi:hypothetical protein